jgi:hypothetical protein
MMKIRNLALMASVSLNVYLLNLEPEVVEDTTSFKQFSVAKPKATKSLLPAKTKEEKIEKTKTIKNKTSVSPLPDTGIRPSYLPDSIENLNEVLAAWDDQVLDLFISFPIDDPDALLKEYQDMRLEKEMKISRFLSKIEKGEDDILGIDQSMNVHEIVNHYGNLLRELLGNKLYSEYSVMRDKYNMELINMAHENETFLIIEF